MPRATKPKEETTLVKTSWGLSKFDDSILVPYPAYAIRNNCKLGRWVKSDGETIISKSIDMAIIGIQPIFGDLGKTSACQWLQVWAVSPQILNGRSVFVTYVKKQSLTLLSNTLLEAALENKDSANCLFRAGFTGKSNEYGEYYILSFEQIELATDDPFSVKIAELCNRMGSQILTDSNLPNSLFHNEDEYWTWKESEEKTVPIDYRPYHK